MRCLAISLVFALFFPTAMGQDRYYVAVGVGHHYAPGVDYQSDNNDRASICDEFKKPLFASVSGCTVPDRGAGDGWQMTFANARGMNGSIAVGMRLMRRVRAELEYLYVHSDYDRSTSIISAEGATADKLNQEVLNGRERLGGVSSNNLLISVLLLLPRGNSRWMPYFGIGAGLSAMAADYASTWARNPNPNAISTGGGQPNESEIRNNLAGTVSAGDAEPTCTGLSWQVLLGADYRLADRVSLGVRARRTDFPVLESTDSIGDPLRSHAPNLRLDGSEPVHGTIRTSELQAAALSMNMRYHL